MRARLEAILLARLSHAARTQVQWRLRRLRRPARLGALRRGTPFSDNYGYERGTPVGRYYIERFLDTHKGDIRGRVLEIKDNGYTSRFGADVIRSDVLDIDPANQAATLFGDLTEADHIPSDAFDCFLLTQTLQYIYNTRAAVAHAFRMLRPRGVLLATIPVLSKLEPRLDEQWRFTPGGCVELFGSVFGPDHIAVQTYGNLLSCVAALSGMAAEELSRTDLAVVDDRYPLLVAVRAVKTPAGL